MAFWINIYGCQPYLPKTWTSKCKSAQKPKLLLGTVTPSPPRALVAPSVDILLDSTRSTEILSWKKIIERVESSKIQKWHSLDSLEFSLLCFERVPSTRRVFLKKHCNFYASTENVLPYCVQHKLESESGDPSKKLNP